MWIGFLANHRLCKHPQNLPMFIYHFSNTFPLHRCLIFPKFWIIDKWSYSTVKQANEVQYAYRYIWFIIRKAQMEFQSRMHWANSLWLCVYGSEKKTRGILSIKRLDRIWWGTPFIIIWESVSLFEINCHRAIRLSGLSGL